MFLDTEYVNRAMFLEKGYEGMIGGRGGGVATTLPLGRCHCCCCHC
jgi:hypothetical protein